MDDTTSTEPSGGSVAPAMGEPPVVASEISYGGIAAAIGGLIGLLGVYIGWWQYTLTASGVAATVRVDGSTDWTGSVAVVASIAVLAFGAAFVIMTDPVIRRFSTWIVAVGGIVMLVVAGIAFGRAPDVIGTPALLTVMGGSGQLATDVAVGLYGSAVGGIFALVGAILSFAQLSKR
jgi:hypothetical protein